MADTAKTFDVKCSGCPRSYSMSLQTLQQKKTCTFCGGKLIVPEAALAELSALASAGAAAQQQKPVSVECPVCARGVFVKPESFGKLIKCQYCTAPMTVSREGAVATPRNRQPGIMEKGVISAASCSACRAKKMVPTGNNLQARCESCGAESDLSNPALASYFEIGRPGQALMTDFAQMALQARWERQDVTLSEANEILNGVNKLDAWKANPQRPFSPFNVEVTAEIVQYGIACNSSAMSDRMENGLMLIFPKYVDGPDPPDGMANEALDLGRGLLTATGPGSLIFSDDASSDEGKSGEGANCLLLTGTSSGCELNVLSRDPLGNLGKAPAKFAQQIESTIGEAMPRAAQQYFAFKAIYGDWADGAMLLGVTAKALQRRLESMGGTLEDKAGDFSQALLPQQALNL